MDISIDEKRVYDGDDESAPVYVVGEFGVAVVETSDDLVGEFGLERRCTARDAAGRDGRVAVATDEDVLIGGRGGFEPLGVGPAVAVGFAGDDLLVAREDGAVVRERDGSGTELGEFDGVRAVDGDFLATEAGVYRATDTDLVHVGLDSARDVSAAGAPLAATDGGLYRLGNGWLAEREGAFRAVSGTPAGRAHAAGEAGVVCYEDGSWREASLPVGGEVVALDHSEGGVYAMTADGTFLLSVGDGWRSQPVGLREARAVAAP